MKLLVTGASGFLGRSVVHEALAQGHSVKALVRPACRIDQLPWRDQVEFCYADLRARRNLKPFLEDVDVVVHLAASVAGSDTERFVATVVGTENLLAAMEDTKTRKLVLISSFSVYDFDAIRVTLDETSPILTRDSSLYERDSYATAKVWQERVARKAVDRIGGKMCIIRPGFIWGKGNEDLAGVGFKLGPIYFRVGGGARLPLTYVENSADAIVRACACDDAFGSTYNLVDSSGEHPKRYHQAFEKWDKSSALRFPLPYAAGIRFAVLAQLASRTLFSGKGKLPGILVPCRFSARFKNLRFSNEKICKALSWEPRVSFERALQETFDRPAGIST